MPIPKDSKRTKTIARFDPIQNSWTKLGSLEVGRSAHGVIQVDNEFIVVGGDRVIVVVNGNEGEPTESCKLIGQSMTCTTREPQLSKFSNYPELMLFP